jgi:hypothetical protein
VACVKTTATANADIAIMANASVDTWPLLHSHGLHGRTRTRTRHFRHVLSAMRHLAVHAPPVSTHHHPVRIFGSLTRGSPSVVSEARHSLLGCKLHALTLHRSLSNTLHHTREASHTRAGCTAADWPTGVMSWPAGCLALLLAETFANGCC